jgi:hypothetical protein
MCEHTQPSHTHTLTPYAHIKTYTQLEDHVLSEIDRVTEGSVDDGHIVLTVVAPREKAIKFIWGHAPVRHPSYDPRDQTRSVACRGFFVSMTCVVSGIEGMSIISDGT